MRLSGEFLSFFDDMENGQRIVHRSTSKVVQKGDKIEILTTNKAGRRWKLTGRIHNRTYLLGDYSADDLHDEGIGTFFLEIKSRDFYDGYWHGYDHTNMSLTGGKYWFIRRFNFEVVSATEADIPAIVGIVTSEFGAGYMTNIADLIKDKGTTVLVAKHKGEIFGFVTAYRINKAELSGLTGATESDPMLRFFDDNGLIGVIKSIAVRRTFHKKGIGFTLFRSAENALVNAGAKCVAVPAWEHDGQQNIQGILKLNDYESVIRRDLFWKEQCDRREFTCAARKDACVCNCVFYKKVIYSTGGMRQ